MCMVKKNVVWRQLDLWLLCVLFSLFYMQQEVRVEEETPEDNARAAAAVTSETEDGQDKELPPPSPAIRSCTLLENLLGQAFTIRVGIFAF